MDETLFVFSTDEKQDIKYLDMLVKTYTLYIEVSLPELGHKSNWEYWVEPEHLYIKIDDDMPRLTPKDFK